MTQWLITSNGFAQILLLLVIVLICIKPLGSYIARVYNNQFVLLEYILGPVEDFIYKIADIDESKEMNWKQYATALLMVSFGGFLLLFALFKFQFYFPLNPQHFPNLNNDLAFNIAVSFITNTNWQSYAGENTLSYLSQTCGLCVQNFLSASMGMAVAIALVRGIARKNTQFIGNFWVDWLRGSFYILLPLAFILAIALGSQGVIQNLKPYIKAQQIENDVNGKPVIQQIPGGLVASQVAIKELGSNGGGFFNANSAHPFENPTPVSNLLELLAIFLIPTSLCYTFGIMVNDRRQGWALLATMTLIFLPLLFLGMNLELSGNPAFADLPIAQTEGNLEGKEVRIGITNSALWASATTATSNGSTNSMHDSYTPLGGAIPLIFLLLSEIVYGGVGSGLFGILIFVFITVFIAGLMVGRTPEYLGKKIESFEIKMASISLLIPVMLILFGSAIAVLTPAGRAGVANVGAQGFTEILYAFASTAGNNGSAMAGLSANTPFYNVIFGIVMLFGRFWVIIPVLAIAGSLAQKNTIPNSTGTLSTHRPIFIIFLMAIICMIGLLTYFPALILAPIAEYYEGIS